MRSLPRTRLIMLALVCMIIVVGGGHPQYRAHGLAREASSAALVVAPTMQSAGPTPATASPPRTKAAPDRPGSPDAAGRPGAWANSWAWPVAPPHPVTRPFDVTGPYDAGHRGIDVGIPPGAFIAAPAPGTVRYAGIVVDRPVLSIAHDDGSISSFEPVDAAVDQGERVEAGQVVGTLSTTATHAPSGGLHLGARVDGAYVNPLVLLGELPRAVLLPLGDEARP